MSNTPRRIVALCCCLLAPAGAAFAALPNQYRLETLDNALFLDHIGKSGAVAGGDANAQPAVWIGGVEHPLANPGTSGSAEWVNAFNESAGSVQLSGDSRASRWTANGNWVDVGSAIPGTSWTTALSDVGDCTVNAYLSDREHAFFSAGCTASTMVDMGTLGNNVTTSGINSNGQVVGSSITGSVYHPFIYASGHMQDLGLLQGFASCGGNGINGKGHVVGDCSKGGRHKPVGYFYNGKRMRKIGNLGGAFTIPHAINYFDVVVGESSPSGEAISAFVLDMGTPGSPMRDLNDMLDSSGTGWHLESAVSINTTGEIIVEGTIDFQQGHHYAVLVPVQ